MNTKTFYRLFALLVILLLSCNFATGLVGSGNGPKNFTAALTAPDVVALKWDAVEGATGYILELGIDKGDSIQFVALPPDRTSYEDLSAPEKSNLTYKVQVITESGLAGKSKIDIATGERKPNPLTVKPEYDKKKTTTKVVGVQGGTLSLVDSNKVEYTLVIPQGAVSVDTEIHMTAVTSIKDWPLDGSEIGAVRLEPEGLILNDPAILTIGIPVDMNPGLAAVGFAFHGDGGEFHLQISDQEKSLTNNLPLRNAHLASLAFQESKHIVRMPMVELNVNGVGQASGDNAANFIKIHPPTGAGAALEQKWAAEAIADDILTPLANTKGWKPPPRGRMEGQEIAKEFANANNCKELTGLMGSFNNWEYDLHSRGYTVDQLQQYSREAWDELANKVKDILENTASECEKSAQPGSAAPAESSCAKALLERIANPGTSNFNMQLQAKMSFKLSNKELQDIKDKLEKCKPKAYHISGSHFGEDGDACDITQPFTIGGGVIMVFTPSDASSGTFAYSQGPFDANGGGTYASGNGIMTLAVARGCVETPLGEYCTDGTEVMSMTPIDSATCTSP